MIELLVVIVTSLYVVQLSRLHVFISQDFDVGFMSLHIFYWTIALCVFMVLCISGLRRGFRSVLLPGVLCTNILDLL